jgi:zinc protease
MHKRISTVLTVAVLTVVGAASVDARAERQSPPPPAPPKPFVLPAHHDIGLDNGARITTVAYGTVPKTYIELVIRAGNAQESDKEVWLSDLTGMLLREGTKTRNAKQLAEAAAEMGGDLDVNTTPDETIISLEVLSEFAPRAIALVTDVVVNPAFPETEVARLKGDLARRLAILKTQPQALAREQFDGAIYANHPYGRYFSTEAMINGFTIDQVRKLYDANFGAARSHLYVAGRFDAAAVESASRQALAGWRRGPEVTPTPPAPPVKPALRVVDRPGAVQSTLIVGLATLTPKSDDYVPFLVTNALLGGSFGSRITANIRERKGYTYSPHSAVDSLDHNSTWLETADVTTNVTGASLTEIFKEVARLRAEPPSAEELRGIQSYLAGTFTLQNSSRQGIVSRLRFVELHQLGEEYLRNYVQRIWAVKPADVQRLAKSYLDPKQMTIVVVGDRKQVDAQLKPWNATAAR